MVTRKQLEAGLDYIADFYNKEGRLMCEWKKIYKTTKRPLKKLKYYRIYRYQSIRVACIDMLMYDIKKIIEKAGEES